MDDMPEPYQILILYRPSHLLEQSEFLANEVSDARGKFAGYRGTARDVTDRIHTEEALRKQSERLRLGQAAARMIVMDWDVVNDVLTWTDDPSWLRGPLPPGGKYPSRHRLFIVNTAASFASSLCPSSIAAPTNVP